MVSHLYQIYVKGMYIKEMLKNTETVFPSILKPFMGDTYLI